jgi:hypothetical protein
MQAMAWWAIPLIATALAILWAVFAARPKGPSDAEQTVAAHQAFREALSRPAPPVVSEPARPNEAGADEAGAAGAGEDRADGSRSAA